ncbi:L,D-transpeptidase family protein [Rhizobium daejeonense]
MLKKSIFLAACAGLIAATPSLADDRYQTRPPVIVSPDLSAPWVMQLGGATRPVVYAPNPVQQTRQQVRTYQQRPVQQRPVAQRRTPMPQATQPQIVQPAAMRPNQPMKTQIDPVFLPQMVAYDTPHKPGTIVIDTNNRFLYLVTGNGQAKRYGVGVGKPGFEWAGTHKITAKKEWPDWTPPKEMISREAAKGHYLPARMDGGPENPLGARAMYLGSTLYRIHGTNAPWTIGNGVSSGCIRMRNEDVVDLYERVGVGTKVIVM